ncbi:zinc-binding dehydrogenase [Virgibacillus soli]|uniref:Zinc-binding dehydrogenase n=1 Tax=Paracerasibacillus soli TaxID=480284 RepID=A0ABU5CQD0_9BACI|nr:zinc-binding dehydrogenase [Virgibacillus soli]MDY0408027.1 zinc-binding dehydrogenase [Virgibacillus soli]
MKAYVHEYGKLLIKDMPEPVAEKGEVVVAIRAAGLNRRDLYIPNRRGNEVGALILGSDGAGIIASVGEGVTNVKEGDAVIINPSLRWFKESVAPPKEFDILGMPDNGTFAEKIVIDAHQVEKKPSFLTWEEAGVLGLAGLTGYRALVTRGQIKAGETVFIPGAGSGVATYLIQFAKNLGATVIVSSRSKEKLAAAKKLGADVAVDTNADWEKELANYTIDLVIESVGRATFHRSLKVLKPGGRIVVFGATTEDTITFDLREFFYGQYTLLGSTMGSREEFRNMTKHVETHQIHPVIDEFFPLERAQEAFHKLEVNKQFGKIGLSF